MWLNSLAQNGHWKGLAAEDEVDVAEGALSVLETCGGTAKIYSVTNMLKLINKIMSLTN